MAFYIPGSSQRATNFPSLREASENPKNSPHFSGEPDQTTAPNKHKIAKYFLIVLEKKKIIKTFLVLSEFLVCGAKGKGYFASINSKVLRHEN